MFRQRLHPLTVAGTVAASILVAFLGIWMFDPSITPHARMFAILIVLSTISVMCFFVGVIRQSVKAGVLREARRDAVKAAQHRAHIKQAVDEAAAAILKALPAMVATEVTAALNAPARRGQLVEEIAGAVLKKVTTPNNLTMVRQHQGDLHARVSVLERQAGQQQRASQSSRKPADPAPPAEGGTGGELNADVLKGYLMRRLDEGGEQPA